MATCDLVEIYGDLAARLPVSEDDDPFLFTRETLPSPPPNLTSDRLVLLKGIKTWDNCFRGDTLDLLARPATLRQLGTLALAVLLHPEPSTVELVLTHPESSVKRFRIRFEHMTMETLSGYWATPTALEYWASDPFPLIRIDPLRDRPGLQLTDEGLGPDDWDSRDTVIGFGGQAATVAMASLFLDAAVFPYARREYQLEGPAGNDVLEPISADIRIVLPGGELWDLIAIEIPD